jgi:WD40 repeat protein/serine/threonine protein kinase
MNERTIFLNALDEVDPERRRAYLDFACAGNPALRSRIEALLQSHQELDTFLEVPAIEQIVEADRRLAFLAPSGEPGSLGRLDHYEVLEIVGQGSTGVVLKARDTKLQRNVAIKVLNGLLAGSDSARKLFVREAQAAAAVRDENVIAIYAVSDESRAPYLVMEYIAGISLAELVKRNGPLELLAILRIGIQMARGLAAAHAQGLVHRDIKPGNILLENGVQRVKITDFGLAYAEKGIITGTPVFMSPEQARGDPFDHRSDLFSLGSVLYTLCTGRLPFQADNAVEVLKRVREDQPRPIREINPDVPDWLCGLIGKLHAKEADDRFASAQEVADLLGRQLMLLQRPFPAPPAGVSEDEASGVSRSDKPIPGAPTEPSNVSSKPFFQRSYLIAVAGLAGLLVVLGALTASLMHWQTQRLDNQHDSSGPLNELQPKSSTAPVISLELLRENIPPTLLALAGGGDPAKAPTELAAVLGDGRFLLPRLGQTAWLDQSPDGKVLAVPLDDDVILFDVPSGKYLRTLKGPGGRVFVATFSRDGRLLAATTRYEAVGGSVRVWDLNADRVLYTNPQPGPTISCAAAFSPDGKSLYTEVNGRIHALDARSGQQVQTLELPPGGVSALCFSPDGRRLAVANWTGRRVCFFDLTGEKFVASGRVLDHPMPVSAVVYSSNGKFLASGDHRGLRLWNAETLQELWEVETEAHQLVFSRDSRILFAMATNAWPRTAHLFNRWDVANRQKLSTSAVKVSAEPLLAFHCLSRDSKVLFVVPQRDATYLRSIDTATGKELFPRSGHVARLGVVAISPDGTTAASAGEDHLVKLWDLVGGKVRYSLKAHTGAVCALAFSPEGKRLASGSLDGTIAIWGVKNGDVVRALLGHSRSFSQIRFSPDGKILAAGAENGTVKVWDAASGKESSPLSGHTGAVRAVAFSPDGTRLASGGEDKNVILHNLVKGGSQRFRAPNRVTDLAFSPDGHILASVGDAPEAAVRLWNLETGEETTWQGHTGHIRGLAFSPSAPLLATCGEDDTVRLWSLTGGDASVHVIGPGPFGGGVRSVAFTPDGRYLATANANGMVYLLRVGEPR